MASKLKLSRRKLAELTNKGIMRPSLGGAVEQIAPMAAPAPKQDNKNRSWKVDGIERDWEGFITGVVITEVNNSPNE